MYKKKIIFWLIWLVIVALGPITVLRVTPFASVVDNRILLLNFLQRILGLLAFSMIFIQIILGSFMHRWIDKLGGWVFKFHTTEGPIAYFIIFLHPLTFVLINSFIGKGLDPFYVFVDVCLLCKGTFEWFYNLGRIGFWLITIGVLAGLLRASTPLMRLHWKKFHILNYIAFFSIWFHSWKLGTDVGTFPFSLIHTPALVAVLIIVIVRISKFVSSRAKH